MTGLLERTADLLSLEHGAIVSKRNLFDLIQYSKVAETKYWSGLEFSINNTPQQGINWVGEHPSVQAVIVKTREGAYARDGWVDSSKGDYRYSLKARKGLVHLHDKANQVLLKQPLYGYPIFLFIEVRDGWLLQGRFSVARIEIDTVVLTRFEDKEVHIELDANQFTEGQTKYATHRVIERSRTVVNIAKSKQKWICDICSVDFLKIYGVRYIEAHHKVPLSGLEGVRTVSSDDFALLCPNCHKAVHLHMGQSGFISYTRVKEILIGVSKLCGGTVDEMAK